jgi:hypothetical protein
MARIVHEEPVTSGKVCFLPSTEGTEHPIIGRVDCGPRDRWEPQFLSLRRAKAVSGEQDSEDDLSYRCASAEKNGEDQCAQHASVVAPGPRLLEALFVWYQSVDLRSKRPYAFLGGSALHQGARGQHDISTDSF